MTRRQLIYRENGLAEQASAQGTQGRDSWGPTVGALHAKLFTGPSIATYINKLHPFYRVVLVAGRAGNYLVTG